MNTRAFLKCLGGATLAAPLLPLVAEAVPPPITHLIEVTRRRDFIVFTCERKTVSMPMQELLCAKHSRSMNDTIARALGLRIHPGEVCILKLQLPGPAEATEVRWGPFEE